MAIATKNNALIVKDGKLADGCECCDGWYCCEVQECVAASFSSVTVSVAGSNRRKEYSRRGNCPGTAVHDIWYDGFVSEIQPESAVAGTLQKTSDTVVGGQRRIVFGSSGPGLPVVEVVGRVISITVQVPAFYERPTTPRTTGGRTDYFASAGWTGSFAPCGGQVQQADVDASPTKTQFPTMIFPGVGCDQAGGVELEQVVSDVGAGSITLTAITFSL